MKKIALIALASLCFAQLGIAPHTQGETNKTQPEDRDWHAFVQTELSTQDMVEKCDEAIAILRKRLDEVNETLKESGDDQSDRLLLQSQEDWRNYVSSRAEFDADVYRGGSLSRIVRLYSVIDAYCDRINDLKRAIEDRKPM